MRTLSPVIKLEKTIPKCCATCTFLKTDYSNMSNVLDKCQRPNGPTFYPDVDDHEKYYNVCKFWKKNVS